MSGTLFSVEIHPRIPERLSRLNELANDLYYSWDRGVRRLLRQLDEKTWKSSLSNPKVFLRRVSADKLEQASHDPIFLADYRRVLSRYDTYMEERPLTDVGRDLDPKQDLVAYFSAEFGFHQSVPIYAGGLGILAGDYCKAMSNLWVPFVGVGILYHEGYFTQHILLDGEQQEQYPHVNAADLPVVAARDSDGNEVIVHVEIQGRRVGLKVWEAKAGHIRLYLLDSDLEENGAEDRAITNRLYGGGLENRIEQEIVLGIGGTRALALLGLQPTVWHINEGHAGFQVLERSRALVKAGMGFDTALELVAANTVFTTHTPVAAGHDVFEGQMVRAYLSGISAELGIDEAHMLGLGGDPRSGDVFNMTTLALRGSRFHNGVSRIHGGVAAEMEGHIWPEIPAAENPMGYVTNGIDVDTFLGLSWVALFDMYRGRGWRAKLTDQAFWKEFIESLPDHVYSSVHQVHKGEMFEDVLRRITIQLKRNGCAPSLLSDITRPLKRRTDTLVIGFARRFATYKRATLLFHDLERVARLLNDPERPVLFIFAGKAHPNDEPGQGLIKKIAEISLRPEFRGKILILEDYNLSMARVLYAGVDVWMNLPEYPKEACGTSGMKAAINGAINLSVLDGWWGEAYDGSNGWGIMPHPKLDPEVRDREEAGELYDLLENDVIPLFFHRSASGERDRGSWIERSKASMRSVLPYFNGTRMAADYLRDYYGPAARQGMRLAEDGGRRAAQLAEWRKRIATHWPEVRVGLADGAAATVEVGETLTVRVKAVLNGLSAEDVQIECLVGERNELGEFAVTDSFLFAPTGETEGHETLYAVDLCSGRGAKGCGLHGLKHYKIRMYPYHELLAHRFECGRMLWI